MLLLALSAGLSAQAQDFTRKGGISVNIGGEPALAGFNYDNSTADSQSLSGKAVIGIAGRCKAQHVPLIAVVGGAERNLPQVYETGVSAVFPIGRLPEDFSVSRAFSEVNLRETIDNILRLLAI